MKRPRLLAIALLGLALLVSPAVGALAPRQVEADDGTVGPHLTLGETRLQLTGVMDSVKRDLSGPAWLMAEGLEPRLQKRPGWDTPTRLRWGELQGPFSSLGAPAQQAGGGVLVPFRNPAPAFSRNVLITRDFSNIPLQTEPHMAVDPTDPEHLLVGVIDYNFPTVTVYNSFDGGRTWEGPIQTPFLRDDLISGGDPVMAFDREGNPYFAYISIGVEEFSVGRFVVETQISSIVLSGSKNAGLAWSEPVSAARSGVTTDLTLDQLGRPRGEIFLSFLDKPWMTVGPHPTKPDLDVIYVTYTDFALGVEILYIDELPTFAQTEIRSTIRVVRSEDGGKSWTDPVSISPTVRRGFGEAPGPGTGVAEGLRRVVQGSRPEIAPDGTLYVAWMDSTDDDSQEGLGEIYVARSEDAGNSFTDPILATVFQEPGFRPRTAFFRYWASAFPQMAIGPEEELYIVYVGRDRELKPVDDGDVFFLRSLDRGESWSRPARLGGDESSSLQFFPAITTDPTGNIHVMWGDMRDDKAQTRYHIYYTQSEDRGQSWGFELEELNIRADDTRVTDFPSNPNKGFPSGLFIGDYFSIAATDEDVYMVWADTRLGEFGATNQKIAFARRRAIPSPELFLSPPAGPGGQEVTLQGFNLQPEVNIFIQAGGVTVAAERTNAEGRFTTRLFMPVSGEGAQEVRVLDESGNVATASFFTEFGFGNIRDLQEVLEQKVDSLAGLVGAPVGLELDRLRDELQGLRGLVEAQGAADRGGDGTAGWVIAISVLGGATLAAIGASLLTVTLQSRRRERTPTDPGAP